MQAIIIDHAEIGTVSSRADGSIAFRVITPELRPSEAGAVCGWHGKACRVTITPDEDAVPDDAIEVRTERDMKTPGQRLRAVLYVLWKEEERKEPFEDYYKRSIEFAIDHFKKRLPPR